VSPTDLAKHLIAVGATYLVVAPFLLPVLHITDRPISPAVWLLVVLSAIANVIVLGYHHVVPAHPKFQLIRWRYLMLHVHIISGSIEFLAGVVGCALGGHPAASIAMAVPALLFHVPSAYFQTPSVFGARAIMQPSYLLCIGMHAFCAVMLLLNPSSLFWTVATFLLFNTYVWVRVFFFLLDKFGLFRHAKYTVAVLLAGLTTTPVVLGEAAMLAIAIGWVAYIGTYSFFFLRSRAEFIDFVRERERDSAFSEGVLTMWQHDDGQDEPLARSFFTLLDRDQDGQISPDELQDTLATSGVSTQALRHFMLSRSPNGLMAFDAFLTHLWTIPELRRVAREVVFARGEERSERDKAHFVFSRLDLDGNGQIDRLELEGLLNEWSLPRGDVQRWMRGLGLRDDEDISFDVFFHKMRPIWRFVFYHIIDARYGSGNDLIERVFSAWRDDAETRRIADDLRTTTLRGMSLLQGADETFIEQLAGCFVEEEHQTGHVLFEAGDPGEEFYIVRSGSVSVWLGSERLAILREGDWLGEGALLSRRARSARAVVDAPCTLYRASSASFAYLMETRPELRAAAEQLDAGRRIDRNQLSVREDVVRGLPFFAELPPELALELAHRLRRTPVSGRFLEQDQPLDALYIVRSGAVTLVQQGRVVTELTEGAFFGEAALLDPSATSPAAEARPDTVLYCLHHDDFAWLAAEHPPVVEAVRRRGR
jgi:CRP-like cAMP-binding protein/Ca2+-binding EF-hand superfamily protein